MTTQRRQYSAQFKAKAAPELIKGQRTVNEIASDLVLSPDTTDRFEEATPRRVAGLLRQTPTKSRRRRKSDQKLCDRAMQVELDWLKKSLGQLGRV